MSAPADRSANFTHFAWLQTSCDCRPTSLAPNTLEVTAAALTTSHSTHTPTLVKAVFGKNINLSFYSSSRSQLSRIFNNGFPTKNGCPPSPLAKRGYDSHKRRRLRFLRRNFRGDPLRLPPKSCRPPTPCPSTPCASGPLRCA